MTTEPGIHRGMKFEDYLAIEAVSQSFLKKFSRSPAHAKAWKARDDEPTPSMEFGSFIHAGKLEPLTVAEQWAVCTVDPNDPENLTTPKKVDAAKLAEMERKTKTAVVVLETLDDDKLLVAEKPASPTATGWYRSRVAEFERVNAGKKIVTQADFDRMVTMLERLDENETTRQLFARSGGRETVLVWIDKTTGLLCKARVDCYIDDEWPTLADLKTAQNADEQWHDGVRPFWRTIPALGYDVQAGFYTDGAKAVTGRDFNFLMVPIESADPYGLRIYDMLRWMHIGRCKYRRWMIQLKQCMESGNWPAYPAGVTEADVPASVEKEFEMEGVS